jgi:Kef-type K+ transport system membrane component KefB
VRGRLALAYLLVFAVGAGLAVTSFSLGADRHAQPNIAGVYQAGASCRGELTLKQSGQFVDASGAVKGKLRFRHGVLTGGARCDAEHARLRLVRAGRALVGTLGDAPFRASFARELPKTGAATPIGPHSNEQVFGRLMLAIAAVIAAAWLVRVAIGRIGQPPVMGEVLAGILLGPTLLGAVWPSLQHYLFPSFIVPLLVAGADIGLAFYLFLVGLELDPRLLRGRLGHAAAISNGSIVLPLGLGILVALPLYSLLAPAGKPFDAFALFMGVAMAITAFPVLARILIERRLLARPIGALTLSAAAVDDVTAWGLLAIASGIAGRGSALHALPVLGYVFAFCGVMALLARPLLGRVSAAYDEAGSVPAGWITAIFVGVLLSSFVSMKAGVAPIFGAFVMGLVMPRRADLSHDVTRRLEDFVSAVLLPLFFVVTGLRTDVGLLDRPVLWGVTLLLLAVAVAGKWLGAMLMARAAGYGLRESSVIGALMNTRGLTELIVLNIGHELGVISSALFTMLVLVALATTFMTAPLIRLIDRRGELSSPVEDELAGEEPAEEPTILVAPLEERNVDELHVLAEALARGGPPRELVLVRPLELPRVGATLAGQERELERASRELDRLRALLEAKGIPARSVAFTSARRADDLVRLAALEQPDLLLVDGSRPLVRGRLPAGEVGILLRKAPCDVAVLVQRERTPPIAADRPVVADQRDPLAFELAVRIAQGLGAPVELVASDEALAERAGTAGLVVVGVDGPRTGTAPTLFVRSI